MSHGCIDPPMKKTKQRIMKSTQKVQVSTYQNLSTQGYITKAEIKSFKIFVLVLNTLIIGISMP